VTLQVNVVSVFSGGKFICCKVVHGHGVSKQRYLTLKI
jgi:hypothetical protein